MSAAILDPALHEWSAAELRQLPPHERDRILTAAASRADVDYRTDESLTSFDAYGEEDLHGRSSNTETR